MATNQDILSAVSELKGAFAAMHQEGPSTSDFARLEKQVVDLARSVDEIAKDRNDLEKIKESTAATSTRVAEIEDFSKRIDSKVPPIVSSIGVVGAVPCGIG